MLNLTTAIYSKFTGSTLASYIGNRMYKGQAPAGVTYPYIVYSMVTDRPDVTFGTKYEDVVIQFSLYSIASGTAEIETMYTYLKTLYDECSLTITGETLICMKRSNAMFQVEEHTTPTGTAMVWVYHVDYSVYVQV
jgi:hypothetical protein